MRETRVSFFLMIGPGGSIDGFDCHRLRGTQSDGMGRGSTEAAGDVETLPEERQKCRQRRKQIEESLELPSRRAEQR